MTELQARYEEMGIGLRDRLAARGPHDMLRRLADSENRLFESSPPRLPWHSLLAALLLIILASAPAIAAGAECTQPTNLPPPEAGQPSNIDGLKSQLIYYECSGAYSHDFSRVIDAAISYVNQRATKGAKLALVLDIDETSLSNWEEIKADDFGFIGKGGCKLLPEWPCGDGTWKHRAGLKALDTLRLFNTAKADDVAIFFISGRKESLFKATRKNLLKAGYSDWNGLILQANSDNSKVQEFKTAKRKEITEQGYTIIANVGDQYSDLNGGYAERVFKVPNPFYFIP